VIDLAVGAKRVAGSQPAEGAVFILFLNADGTVKDYILINEGNGGFTGTLTNGDEFGAAVACIGDVDGDGTDDLAVGAQFDNDGGPDRGSVWILFMNPDGTVAGQTRLSDTVGGDMPQLDDEDQFGHDIAALGDLDGDGFVDIAVGAGGDDYQGFERGAVHILYLDAAGQAKSHVTINNASPNFTWWLADQDRFGMGLAYLRDVDGDGFRDLAVGCQRDDDGGINRGSVYLISLRPDASINNMLKISPVVGGFDGPTTDDDRFGLSVGVVGDLDGDGQHELVVGAPTGTDDGEQVGITWVLFLHRADEISLVPGQQDVPQGPPGGPGPGVQPPAPLPPGIDDVLEQVFGHRLRGWPFERR